MTPEKLSLLSDSELLSHAKQIQKTKVFDAVFFGVLIGVAIYASVKKGFGLMTFIPLVYLPIAKKNNTARAAAKAEVEKRGLKLE